MIIIKVQGGLGNQLLQYSFGKLLKVMYGKDVAYDLSFFENETKYTKRPYLLDFFAVDIRVATPKEIESVKYPWGIFSKVATFSRKILNKYIFKKYYIGYDKQLLHTLEKKDRVYLEGFWQGYRYYIPILEILQNEIVLKEKKGETLAQLSLDVQARESVSVHIRRGDYVTAGAGLSVLDLDYYRKAIDVLSTKVAHPHYYIFSDDIVWVKNTMGHLFTNCTYVSLLGLLDYEEFILMSECKHAIIANSTFSWLASLLNKNAQAVVICPNDWKNSHFSKGDSNLCPPNWIKI